MEEEGRNGIETETKDNQTHTHTPFHRRWWQVTFTDGVGDDGSAIDFCCWRCEVTKQKKKTFEISFNGRDVVAANYEFMN